MICRTHALLRAVRLGSRSASTKASSRRSCAGAQGFGPLALCACACSHFTACTYAIVQAGAVLCCAAVRRCSSAAASLGFRFSFAFFAALVAFAVAFHLGFSDLWGYHTLPQYPLPPSRACMRARPSRGSRPHNVAKA